MNQLQAMRVFVKVVELSSFGLAGKQLGMSPAAVSRSIALLEAHLNMRLLNRSTRSFALTEAGHEYLAGCRTIIEKLDEVESSLVMSSRQPTGTLRIATSMLYAVSGLCGLLNAYRAEYPDVAFDVHAFDSTFDFVEGGFEIGFMTERKLPSSSLISRRLTTLTGMAVASPAYLSRRGRPRDPVDLRAHDMVQTPVSSASEWSPNREPGAHRVTISHSLSTSSSEMARQAALAHMGIAVLPPSLIDSDLRAGLLEQVLPEFTITDDERDVSLVYSGRRYLSAKTRSFIDFVVSYYRESAWPTTGTVPFGEEQGIAA